MTFDQSKVADNAQKLAVDLSRQIGDHKVVLDRDLLESYSKDESVVEPRLPDVVVRVASTEDVNAVLRAAQKHQVPTLARGGGTGKAGGAIPAFGGVVVDMSKLAEIKEIDRENLLAVVQPGVITGEFQEIVEKEGLFYPPDPNSLENCQLGGNVAHNAGGPRAFKYGVTREYVMGLEAQLMGGETIRVGKQTVKGVAGYDLTALLVGSEGTLGVFTELVMRLRIKPPKILTLLVRFANEQDAGRAVARTIAAGLTPRVLEFMDSVLVDTLRMAGAGSVPADTNALLLVELDGDNEDLLEEEALRFADICEEEGSDEVMMAKHVGEREQLWAARRTLSDAVKKRANYKVAEDIVVPRSKVPEMFDGLRRLGEKYNVLTAAYGHAGDGNYHVNVLYDDPDFDTHAIVKDIFTHILSLGGTITGEHGVGLAKRPYLPMEKSPYQLDLMRSIKRQFDPNGLLNPGKIF